MTDSNLHRANPRFLGILTSYGKFRSWFYADMDEVPMIDILSPGFFGDLKRRVPEDTIRAGDMITISCREGMCQRMVEHADEGRVVLRPMYDVVPAPRPRHETVSADAHLDAIETMVAALMGPIDGLLPGGLSQRDVGAALTAVVELRRMFRAGS